jgi:hypothetical protein
MIEKVNQLKQVANRVATGSLAVILIVSAPAPVYVYADDDPSCSPVTATSGVQKPTGADAVTYTYNSCTGLWENPHYTWSPATKQATPKDPQVYTYNNATGKWDCPVWGYVPANDSWSQYTVSVATPPEGAQTVGGPSSSAGPGSTGDQSVTNDNNVAVNSTTNAAVTNNIGSDATTGAASVSGNTVGGSALSGNAQSIANVINMLQSSSGLGSTAATFTANIDGDVQGDLVIDPDSLQPATTNADVNSTNNLQLNVANNGQITNNLNLNATSGSATVANNTKAGNAKSGNAQAVANVVNMINSMITANKSFVGVLNINGNFNGNILMPQKFLDNLIASNAPHSDVTISQNAINNVVANISNNSSIANNVTSKTTTGDASVTGNTSAGSAKSGNAKTNVTIFDLTGVQVTGGNVMLVFVNVLGKWVGVLMNAPAGSTAAAFGGGITNSSVNSTNNANLNATNNAAITNNIGVTATSGSATVAGNTKAGSAQSGDAETAVNLNNITNSSLNLTGWFGILFINVFGNWNGNFGVMTSHDKNAAVAAAGPSASKLHQVFGFAPHAKTSVSGSSSTSGTSLDAQLTGIVNTVKEAKNAGILGAQNAAQQVATAKNQGLIIGGALFAFGLTILLIEQVRSRLRGNAGA